MENKGRKLSLYISMSLDGFLATEDDGLAWLDAMDVEGEDYGYTAFTSDVEAYIVGRRTYEVVLALTGGDFPQSKLYDCYIINRRENGQRDGVTFYNGNIRKLVERLKSEGNGKIYCDGGGIVTQMLLQEDLIDEMIVAVIPVILGNGKRLFLGETPHLPIKLVGSKSFVSGLVQLHYVRDRLKG